MFTISSNPIDGTAMHRELTDSRAGACVTFEGWVRNRNEGQPVISLEYEAYAPAAELSLAQIGDEIRDSWGIEHVAIFHRVGSLTVGEASVVISVASAHREDAFAACRYAIERIKEIVPIWKKEHYASGATAWINCATRGTHGGEAAVPPA